MLRCPRCQTQNPPHAKFCFACGLRFLICPYCGTANPPMAHFCIECGRAQGPKGRWPERADTFSLPASTASRREESWGETPSWSPVPGRPEAPAQEQATGQIPALSTPEERRVVTVMFADITGSTPLADHLDPEDMRAILAGYFNLMTEQIRRHGGIVEKYIGDAVMAVFGLPQAHEDDPDRAIRAALDMQAALVRFNQARRERDPEAIPLQMRIGINTGEVATPGPDGSFSRRGDFLVTGDAVNIAARLQQVASPDTILVGERTYLATRETFRFRPLAPLHVKGKAEAIRAWVVLGLAEEQPASVLITRARRGLLAPLIGRSLELTLMHATYARVLAERQPHLITLLGPSGIGKSRLVHEFIEREQEKARSTAGTDQGPAPLVMYGRCPPYGEGITYWPLIEILRALLQVQYNESDEEIHSRFTAFVSEVLEQAGHKEDAAGVAEAILLSIGRQLGASATLAGGERRERQRTAYARNLEQSGTQMTLLRSWRIFLAALAQRQPLILVIDDLQWADEALLDLLEHLMERLSNAPLLLLCPARPEFLERRQDWGGGQRNFTTIVLEALSPDESKELVRALLKNSELPEALCHTILSRAEGNPFFVEELIRMFIDQGILVYEQDSWRVAREKEHLLSDLASPAGPPDDALLDLHYTLPLPRVPDTIQGVLAARVDLLSPVEKHVLQKAAIIGRTFWLSGLRELTADLDEETLLQTLESLITRDFISESERRDRSPVENDRVFSFKHILTRDVVYHTLSRSHRAVSHARLARWLEEQVAGRTERFVELLAYHYQQAASNWTHSLLAGFAGEETKPELSLQELRERATVYLTRAGDQALRSYYTIRAIQAYSDALELLRESGADGRALARMYEKLGDAFTQRANLKEAWQAYRQALQLLGTEPEPPSADLLYLYDSLAELATRWGPWHDTPPDMDEVRTYIDAGLALAEDQGDRAVFLTYLALWYMHRRDDDPSDIDERARRAEQALQSAREARRLAEEAQDVEALWLALDALGGIYMKLCDYVEAHRTQHQRQQLQAQIIRQQGRPDRQELHDLYYSLGWVHFFICDYPTAARWFGEAWQVAQTMESPSLLLLSMLGRIHVWYEWDRWDDAREAAQKALQLIEQYQLEEMWEIDALKHLVLIAFQTGDYEQGERYLRRLKLLSEQVSSLLLRLDLELAVQIAREEWSSAAETLKEEIRHHEPFVKPEQQALLAELLTRRETSAEEQARWCQRALVAARRSQAIKAEGRALRAQGRLALTLQRWEEARTCLQQALELFERLDLPWERGQTLYCLGELYRRQAASAQLPEATRQWRELARHSFTQALGFFRALHAVRDIERASKALQEL